MSSTAISIEGLSKRYLIGKHRANDDGFRHVLEDALRAPLRWLGRRNDVDSKTEAFWALRDVSFQVKAGEVMGIIGRNGAGKSTLLKVLSRITEPTIGRVAIDGRVASLLEVGTGFHPELTGRENIFLNGAILGMSRSEIRRKFDEIVAFSEVEQFLDTPVKHYSSGMYVRLAFSVAAHLEPDVLIVDEVLAVGDAQFQKKCLGKMTDVAHHGRTILFVSHNMAAIQNLCSKAVLLERGRIALFAETTEVVRRYLQQDQTDHTFRRQGNIAGDGRAKLSDLRFNASEFKTGAALELIFTVEVPSAEDLIVEISVDFLSDYDTRVLQLYSRNVGSQFLLRRGQNRIKMHVPALELAPGSYNLSAWVGFGHVTFDLVPNCCSFSVDTGAFVEGYFVENRGIPVVGQARWEKA